MGHWLLKWSENSLNFIKNTEFGYITSAILHLSHGGKTTFSKLTKYDVIKEAILSIKKKNG